MAFIKDEQKPPIAVGEVRLECGISAREPAAGEVQLFAVAITVNEDNGVVQRARVQTEYLMGLLTQQQKANLLNIMQSLWDQAEAKLL